MRKAPSIRPLSWIVLTASTGVAGQQYRAYRASHGVAQRSSAAFWLTHTTIVTPSSSLLSYTRSLLCCTPPCFSGCPSRPDLQQRRPCLRRAPLAQHPARASAVLQQGNRLPQRALTQRRRQTWRWPPRLGSVARVLGLPAPKGFEATFCDQREEGDRNKYVANDGQRHGPSHRHGMRRCRCVDALLLLLLVSCCSWPLSVVI
mmetsp:Transcript_130951/g.261231  ORF Transcript_130951/g.261231 Transcript_130951/m.261231 type:complete len:203 (-) Transcript_130951:246-854(-)